MKQLPRTKGQFALVDNADYQTLVSLGHWCYAHNGYAVLYCRDGDKRTTRFLHRVVMEWILGHSIPRNYQVDHISRDRLDNRRENLRLATRSQNQANKGRQSNTSCYKGVNWNRNRWEARIRFQGRRVYLGKYDNPLTAALLYDAASRRLYRDFAGCNFPDLPTPLDIEAALEAVLARRGF